VLFVILAAGYLLKYSIDQGWISPLVRCIGGALAGIAIGAVGWRLHDKGLRVYGAALVGCGAAVIYLAVWAACYLYQFLPPPQGIAGLALVSLGLAAVAFAIDVQALCATAVLGAFFAPILLGQNASNADALLLYLGFMALALGWVAARRRWRLTAALIAVGYFGLAMATEAADQATPWLSLLFGLVGGSLGLYVGLRDKWWETRFLAFTGGWTLVWIASQRVAPWGVVLAGVALAIPVWHHALTAPSLWPIRRAEDSRANPWSVGEALYFYGTPILLGWAIHGLNPQLFDRQAGLVPLIVAAPYLLVGYSRVRAEFALVGTTSLGLAALAQWGGLEAVWALLALSLLWTVLDHALERDDGRWYGLLALGAGLAHLLLWDSAARSDVTPAFIDRWALTLWLGIACVVLMARGLWKTGPETRGVLGALWVVAGILLFGGVTQELPRFFGARGYSAEATRLLQNESQVVWWLLFFGGLLVLGVLRKLPPLRFLAGMGLFFAALYLASVDLFSRGNLDPAFWGLWAGALWLFIATLAGLAVWVSRRAEPEDELILVGLWVGAGALLLLGVTGELDRFFGHRNLEGDTAALWTGLSISVWWILFAFGLILLGFRRGLRLVRQAGLLVAAMAAGKILVYDLSSLNALYRVGSVFIAGLVSLLLAYLYNRKARDARNAA
jgi:uncharacterized membrane protein